jgi:LCP family protein required for cell wall assembly
MNTRVKWTPVLMILIVLLGLFAGCGFNEPQESDEPETPVETEEIVQPELEPEPITESAVCEIKNIALFGVDTRSTESIEGLSDCIIVLSIDVQNSTVKMTSILRDSRVYIDGYGYNKINAAYSFGGPELAMDTINSNFNLDIEDYVTVNFAGLADIIDALGGVEVEITEEERVCINDIMDMDDIDGDYLYESGLVTFTGDQATQYARIRSIDSDVGRSGRQRTVISAMLAEIKEMNLPQTIDVIRLGLKTVDTSLSYGELYDLAKLALSSDLKIEDRVIPSEEEAAFGGIIDGIWYYDYDIEVAAEHLHTFIYGPEATDSTSTSDDIQSTTGSTDGQEIE